MCTAITVALIGTAIAALILSSGLKQEPREPNQWKRYRGIMRLRASAPPLVGYKHR